MKGDLTVMSRKTGTLWQLLLVLSFAALCFAPGAFAQTIDVTSAGNFGYDGVYISPYSGTVNGTANTTIICNDFADETQLNTPWNVGVTTFSSLSTSLGNTLWGSYYKTAVYALAGTALSATQIVGLYDEAAWLAEALLTQTPGSHNQAYYSYAVWAVFDPNAVAAQFTKYNDQTACQAVFGASAWSGSTCTAQLGGLLKTASSQTFTAGEFSNLLILTPLNGGNVCSPTISGAGNCAGQEFFAVVAEGGSAATYLLLAGLVCFGAIRLRSRDQGSRKIA